MTVPGDVECSLITLTRYKLVCQTMILQKLSSSICELGNIGVDSDELSYIEFFSLQYQIVIQVRQLEGSVICDEVSEVTCWDSEWLWSE